MKRNILISIIIIVLTIISMILFTIILPNLASLAEEMGAKEPVVNKMESITSELCGIGLCSVKLGLSPTSKLPVVSRGFMLQISILIAGLALATYYYLKDKLAYNERLRQQVTEFLPLAASLAQTKATTIEILKTSSNLIEDPLQTLLKRMIHLITLGEDPEIAAKIVSNGAPVEVKAVFDSLGVGAKSGGRFAEILERANEYFMEVFRMERSVKTRLGEYKMIALLASLTFVIASIVSLKLIVSMTTGQVTLPSAHVINFKVIESALFITAIVIAIMASIVIGKVIEGKIAKSLKYIAITALITGLAFAFYPLFL